MQSDFEKNAIEFGNAGRAAREGIHEAWKGVKDTLHFPVPGLDRLPSPLTDLQVARTTADLGGMTPGVRATTQGGTRGFRGERYAPTIPTKPVRVNRSVGKIKVGFAKQAGHMAALQQYGLLS